MGAGVLRQSEGATGFLGTIGVRFLVDGSEPGRGFSLVEHPLPARALAAPMHKHHREDEYSYVLEGRIGALLGDEVLIGNRGDLIFKPRHQWHTFWNAGDVPARILEIISPAGFEVLFREVIDLGGMTKIAPEVFAEILDRYGLEMDLESFPRLLDRFSLRFPGEPLV